MEADTHSSLAAISVGQRAAEYPALAIVGTCASFTLGMLLVFVNVF